MWADELWSINATKEQITEISGVWYRGIRDTTMPLYYIILYIWQKLFGYTQINVQLLSIIFVIFSTMILHRALLLITEKSFAFILCLFYATFEFVLNYSSEVRHYGMSLFLMSAIMFFYLKLSIGNQTRSNLIFLFSLMIILIYTNWYGFFVFTIITGSILFFFIIPFKRIFPYFIVSVLCLTPLYSKFLTSLERKKFSISYPDDIYLFFVEFLGSSEVMISLIILIFLRLFLNQNNYTNLDIKKHRIFLINITMTLCLLLGPFYFTYFLSISIVNLRNSSLILIPMILVLAALIDYDKRMGYHLKRFYICSFSILVCFQLVNYFVIKKNHVSNDKDNFRSHVEYILSYKKGNKRNVMVIGNLAHYVSAYAPLISSSRVSARYYGVSCKELKNKINFWLTKKHDVFVLARGNIKKCDSLYSSSILQNVYNTSISKKNKLNSRGADRMKLYLASYN